LPVERTSSGSEAGRKNVTSSYDRIVWKYKERPAAPYSISAKRREANDIGLIRCKLHLEEEIESRPPVARGADLSSRFERKLDLYRRMNQKS